MTTFYPRGTDGEAVSITVRTMVAGEEVTQTMESGCYVDGHWGQYGSSRVLRIADDILGTSYVEEAGKVRECLDCGADIMHPTLERQRECSTDEGTHRFYIPQGIMTDEYPSTPLIIELADEAEAALNDATTGGYWGWEDGDFFLRPDLDGMYYATIERMGNATHHSPEPYVYVSSVDGRDGPDWSPSLAYGMWRVDIGTVDVDGDTNDDEVFSILAIWHGGCYVDLHSSGGDDMGGYFGRSFPENVPWAADASEVIHIEGTEVDGVTVRTILDVEKRVEEWVRDCIEAQGTDDDYMAHNFSHYGFALP